MSVDKEFAIVISAIIGVVLACVGIVVWLHQQPAEQEVDANGGVILKSQGYEATAQIVELEGQKYVVVLGYKTVAVCPTKENINERRRMSNHDME